MKVITGNPVMFNSNQMGNNDMWLSLDGSSSKAEIKAFQDWMDMKHPNWVNGKNLNKGGGYGTFGPSTKKAWASVGNEFSSNLTTAVVNAPTPQVEKALAGTNYSTTNPATGEKRKGMFFDKVKNLWVKASDSGLLSQLGGILGGMLGLKPNEQPGTNSTWTGETPGATPPAETGTPGKKPMTTTTKVLIGVGVVLVLGTIIYLATKKNTPATK